MDKFFELKWFERLEKVRGEAVAFAEIFIASVGAARADDVFAHHLGNFNQRSQICVLDHD